MNIQKKQATSLEDPIRTNKYAYCPFDNNIFIQILYLIKLFQA